MVNAENGDLKDTPGKRLINLVRSAYDTASCGIGVQMSLVKALLGSEKLNEFQKKAYMMGCASNLLTNPITLDIYSEGKSSGGEPNPFGEDASQRIRSKYGNLEELSARLYRTELRCLGRGEVTYNTSPLTAEEVAEKLEQLQQQGLLGRGESPISQETLEELVMEKSFHGAKWELMQLHSALFSEEGNRQLENLQHSKTLREYYIQFHAGKLDLMVDIVQSAMEAAQNAGYFITEDFNITFIRHGTNSPQSPTKEDTERWQASWKRNFGEDLPTIHQLLEGARETIAAARAEYSPSTTS